MSSSVVTLGSYRRHDHYPKPSGDVWLFKYSDEPSLDLPYHCELKTQTAQPQTKVSS